MMEVGEVGGGTARMRGDNCVETEAGMRTEGKGMRGVCVGGVVGVGVGGWVGGGVG